MLPRIAWLSPMPYEVNVDEVRVVVNILLSEDVDANDHIFNTCNILKMNAESSEP